MTSLMNGPYQENENDDEDDDGDDREGDGDARDLAALQGRHAAHEVTNLKNQVRYTELSEYKNLLFMFSSPKLS